MAPKPDAFAISQREGAYGVPSPQFQATPTSHVSSPSHAKSPGYGFQGGLSPVEVNAQGAGRPQLLPQPRTFTSQTSPGAISMPQTDPNEKSRGPRGARVAAAYYPSPFQKHYDQLGKRSFALTSYIFGYYRWTLADHGQNKSTTHKPISLMMTTTAPLMPRTSRASRHSRWPRALTT